MFKKILIANRGAIAVRIERTLKKLGIESVAVYTKADQDSLHVDLADEAILIGEGPVKDSYLNAEKILSAAKETGAEAIHPGYGFLSENTDFARACQENGIVFIGPSSEQIELFGLKHEARRIAKETGVPLLPGTELLFELEQAVEAASAIGYPVMLKSTAGGGGIGMRVCQNEQELRMAYDSVCRLAETNFNNAGVFLEKFIAKARHVEVQIFGSNTGGVMTLGERDCSVQRRNQKVLEEAPAPGLSSNVRKDIQESAKRLAETVGYRNAGTVEFLYDPISQAFYFLEVNTRLQVEHGVTEEVLGIDLVEWMILEAAGNLKEFPIVQEPKGHSIEVRVYAEDCLNQFIPSAGKLDAVRFSGIARNETWVRDGATVSSFYDPMLAKIIVHAESREAAISNLSQALQETRLYGVTTNLQYLQMLLEEEDFKDGAIHTKLLESFSPREHALEVLDGGIQTTVQDWPGRKGHWDVGVPPCGPMDALSFRMGNKLLGNEDNAAGLELTLRGGAYRFRDDMWFCITGTDMQPTLDGEKIQMYKPLLAKQGQKLVFKEALSGMRAYLLVAGGLDMPKTLGSSSTFTLGNFGGHGGRALRTGDVLRVVKENEPRVLEELSPVCIPAMEREWTIGMIPGPHCSEEFLDKDYLKQLTATKWDVHFNSSRTGVRLSGPAPKWTREDGGEAGLHPSNIHDNAYAIGTLDLTGDMPILLGPDGPSLGGFVCPVTTATAELWKIGQLHPGDTVRFQLLSLEQAEDLRADQEHELSELSGGSEPKQWMLPLPVEMPFSPEDCVLAKEKNDRRFPITVRCSGDENLLVEYGEMELDLMLRFQVQALIQMIKDTDIIPYLDLTPGIRSLQIHIDASKTTVAEVCQQVLELDKRLPELESIQVPSRIVRLPLSWDDPATQLATERYQQNVRPDAPWCPDNIEFIRRINGLKDKEEVKEIVYNANYLVLGLGDVYLGAPVATPLDPRHRLVTTKYNPARTWTPENAVGIGGAYMCVYGMEGPGGYQFVGRTLQMWNPLRSTKSFQEGKPWLLRFFDMIQYYPVKADELLALRENFLRGKFEADITETTFSLGEYLQFLESTKESTEEFQRSQQSAFMAERERWQENGLSEFISDHEVTEDFGEIEVGEGEAAVYSSMPGSVWKVLVSPGQLVSQGDPLIIEESMKMEFPQTAPCDGVISAIYVKAGDEIHAGKLIVTIMETENQEVLMK